MGARSGESTIPSQARWEQIERLLAAIAQLAQARLPTDAFANGALAQVVQALPCAAAGFWAIDGEQISLTAFARRDEANCPPSLQAIRLALVQQVVATKAAQWQSAPQSATGTGDLSKKGTGTSRPSEFQADSVVSLGASPLFQLAGGREDRIALLVAPVMIDDDCVAALELIQSEDRAAADPNWTLDVLGSVAELFADDCRRRRMHWLTERELLWRRLREFSLQLQRISDVEEIANLVVNDGRLLIDGDRLTLLIAEAGRCRPIAVSGAVTCDPRSDAMRHLEQTASAIAALGAPFVFPPVEAPSGGAGALPPEIRTPVMASLDATGAKSLAAVPLHSTTQDSVSPASAGVLVIEQFSKPFDAAALQRLELVAEHAAPALEQARRRREAPWRILGQALVGEERWNRVIRGRSRLRLWLYAAGAVFVLAWIIPASYEIEARGELQPKMRREVFAPDDAVVDELKVDHDDRVEAGQVLAILRNPELDLEAKRISGELQTTRERLAAVQAARVELAIESAGRPGGARLSGEEAALRAQLASLERQLQLVDEQQTALTVRSPIAGRVLTWDLPQLLQSRPVQRGQVLMTVADPEGPWVLELRVPEQGASALIKARQTEPKLPVAYVLATDPGQKHHANIDDVSASIEPDRGDESSILVTVPVDRDVLQHGRPGAGATGRVYCGLRPIAYVWFHDLIDAAWAWIWF